MIEPSTSARPTDSENPDAEQHIRERAYELWELEGKPEGTGEKYWHRAKELIEAQMQSSYPPTQSRAHRT